MAAEVAAAGTQWAASDEVRHKFFPAVQTYRLTMYHLEQSRFGNSL
jgi:hypothetical protein